MARLETPAANAVRSKTPPELDVRGAFDFFPGGWQAKFGMVIVQEVLPDDGTLQRPGRLPAQAPLELAIGGNGLVRDPTHIAKPEIDLHMGAHIQGLTQEPLMFRIMRFRAAEGLVRAARFGTDVQSQ